MIATHPHERELADFLLGKLADADHARLEEHLAECPACQTCAAAKASSATFVELLAAADTLSTAERLAGRRLT